MEEIISRKSQRSRCILKILIIDIQNGTYFLWCSRYFSFLDLVVDSSSQCLIPHYSIRTIFLSNFLNGHVPKLYAWKRLISNVTVKMPNNFRSTWGNIPVGITEFMLILFHYIIYRILIMWLIILSTTDKNKYKIYFIPLFNFYYLIFLISFDIKSLFLYIHSSLSVLFPSYLKILI